MNARQGEFSKQALATGNTEMISTMSYRMLWLCDVSAALSCAAEVMRTYTLTHQADALITERVVSSRLLHSDIIPMCVDPPDGGWCCCLILVL